MRNLLPSFCLALGFLCLPMTASVVSNVSCASLGAPLAAGSTNCYAQGSSGFARSNVTTGVTMPMSVGDAAVVAAASSVSALQTGIRGITATATASSTTDISLTFATGGAARNGLLELILDQTAWTAPVNGLLSESVNVASHLLSPSGMSTQTVWLPIQLGTQFGFDYKQSITAIGSSLSGLTSGELALQIELLAFEADGVTAAQLFDPPGIPVLPLLTPEPSSLGLIAIACITAGGIWLKRRR